MKYEKPMVTVDQFKLSQAIAGCHTNVGHTDSLCFMNSKEVPGATTDLAVQGYFIPDSCGRHIYAGATYDQFGNVVYNYDGICIHTQVGGPIVS